MLMEFLFRRKVSPVRVVSPTAAPAVLTAATAVAGAEELTGSVLMLLAPGKEVTIPGTGGPVLWTTDTEPLVQ